MSESSEAAQTRRVAWQSSPQHDRRGEEPSGNAAGETAEQSGNATEPVFRERLYASWWTWPLPVAMAALLAAEVHMGYPGIRAWLPYLLLIPLAIAVPLWLSRTRIEVGDSEFRAGNAHIPLRFIAGVDVVAAAQKRRALGPELDPAAFIVHRPWVPTAVRVWLDDDNDPTPYWVISTRQPEKLAELLDPAEQNRT